MSQQDDSHRYRGTTVVYAMHPSRSVNHEEANPDMRKELFRSICEACHTLSGTWNEDAWEDDIQNYTSAVSEIGVASASRFTISQNTKRLESFLEVVLRSCFLPVHRLPSINVAKRTHQRYRLEHWHNDWFKHVKEDLSATGNREHQAREFLIRTFEQLNGVFRRISWYRPIYEVVDWPSVCQVCGRLSEMEYACLLLDGGTEADTDRTTGGMDVKQIQGEGGLDLHYVMTKMEEITARSTKVWNDRRQHQARVGVYLRLAQRKG